MNSATADASSRKLSRGLGLAAPIAFLSLLLLLYTWSRAAALSFTHDECLSYIYHVKPGLIGLLDFSVATNHFLNSALMAISNALLGPGEFALRLPNLLAHAAFLFATYRIVRLLGNPIVAACGFVLLNMNPFMLDFFSLARGYGIGMAFMMWSLYFRFAPPSDRGSGERNTIASVWFAWLATLSNLSFANFYLALVATGLWMDAIRLFSHFRPAPGDLASPESEIGVKKHVFSRQSQAPAKHGGRRPAHILRLLIEQNSWLPKHLALFALSVIPIGLGLRLTGELYYGGTLSFQRDTVESLITASFYGKAYPPHAVAAALVLAEGSLLIGAALSYSLWMRKRGDEASMLSTALSVIALAALSSVAQRWLLGSKYLTERTALFFIPLFWLAFVCLMDMLVRRRRGVLAGASLTFVVTLTLLCLCHNAIALNRESFLTWKYDANTREMLKDLDADHLATLPDKKQISLGINWLFEPSVNYYRITKNLAWLKPATRMGLEGKYDYYFYTLDDLPLMKKKPIVNVKLYTPSLNVFARQPE